MGPYCRIDYPLPLELRGFAPSRESEPESGFTLLEIMISITLLVILIAVIGGALRLTYRSINTGERKIEDIERLRNTVAFMSAQIQSAIPLTEGEGADKKFVFEGEKDTLQFATTTSIWGNQKGPVLVTYKLSQHNDAPPALHIVEQVIGLQSKKEAVLLNATPNLVFEYYYKKPSDDDGVWSDSWKEPDIMPERVRIHFGPETRQWTFVFPVRMAATLSQGATTLNTTTIQ